MFLLFCSFLVFFFQREIWISDFFLVMKELLPADHVLLNSAGNYLFEFRETVVVNVVWSTYSSLLV